jgi:hypothetical protein
VEVCGLPQGTGDGGRRPHLLLRADARGDARAIGAAADGADARPAPTVQGALPDARGAPAPRRVLTACFAAARSDTRGQSRASSLACPTPCTPPRAGFRPDTSTRTTSRCVHCAGLARLMACGGCCRHAWRLSRNSRPHTALRLSGRGDARRAASASAKRAPAQDCCSCGWEGKGAACGATRAQAQTGFCGWRSARRR